MIAKRYKLPMEDFIKKNRKRTIPFSCFSLKILPNTFSYNRIGVVISAKTVKKAVDRVYWRRILFDAASQWPNKNLDIAIYFTPHTNTSKEDVVKDMERVKSVIL